MVDFTDLAGEITPNLFAVAEVRPLGLKLCYAPTTPCLDFDRYWLLRRGEIGYEAYYCI